jgi:tetratricopeptide (TPR) repeat protein
MTSRLLSPLVVALTLLAAAPARAGQDPVAAARERFRRGSELYEQGRFREAAAEFEAAYRLRPHGAIHYNVARCRERLGEWPGALRSYEDYLREVPDAKDRAAVRAAMRKLEENLASAGVQVLLVYSDPLGAEVRIEGTVRGTTPFHTVLPPGPYALTLVLGGYTTERRDVTLAHDASLVVDVPLAPAQPAAAAAPGKAPDLAPRPPAPAGQALPPDAGKSGPARSGRVWTWVAAGASAVALAAGAYYGASAARSSDELRDGTVRTGSENEALRSDAERDRNRANVLYGIAGAAGAAGVTLFFLEGRF